MATRGQQRVEQRKAQAAEREKQAQEIAKSQNKPDPTTTQECLK